MESPEALSDDLLSNCCRVAICLSYLKRCVLPGFDLFNQLYAVVANDGHMAIIKELLDEWTGELSSLFGLLKIGPF